MFAVTFSEIAD